MFKTFRIISIVFLIFNAITALFGGILLVIAPSGKLLQMPIKLLEYTPFTTFLIPGLILLIFNGLLSLLAAWVSIWKIKKYPSFIVMQGVIMLGWIVVEMLMLRVFYAPLHLPYLFTGTGLVVLGYVLLQKFEHNLRKNQ